ncbi:reverse transcriptase domain-containing protein [Tanacetum coccineum]
MLERLARHEYYCFLDGFLGYFQILITPEDQEKTTFTYPYGTFAYKRMPSRLCNAPTTFQRCMTAIFHELNENIMEEKCHFMVKEGIVLGHKVSGSGIEVDKAKIEAISKLPYPTNVKAIQSFLGHAGFYRRFIKDFSQIARPMTQLLVKDAPFNFSEECIQAFDTLKRKLTQALIMIKPDWSFPFEIMCDASDYAVGAVLGQDRQTFQAHTLCQQNNERSTRELHNYQKGASGCRLCIQQILSILGFIQDHRFHGSFYPVVSLHKTRCKTIVNSIDPAALRIQY